MTRQHRRLLAAAVVATATAVAPMVSASADTTLTVTAVPGTLSVAGVGTAAGNLAPGGGWTALTGVTVLTVSDLRGSAAGWHITAQFQAPVAPVLSLTGSNVRVSTGNPAGDALSNVKTFSNVTLGSVATILNTYGTGTSPLSGAGISTADASFAAQIPATAQLTDVYGGSVVYTAVSG